MDKQFWGQVAKGWEEKVVPKVQAQKFYFYDRSGERIEALFQTEKDGHEWGKEHDLEYSRHDIVYVSIEAYKHL